MLHLCPINSWNEHFFYLLALTNALLSRHSDVKCIKLKKKLTFLYLTLWRIKKKKKTNIEWAKMFFFFFVCFFYAEALVLLQSNCVCSIEVHCGKACASVPGIDKFPVSLFVWWYCFLVYLCIHPVHGEVLFNDCWSSYSLTLLLQCLSLVPLLFHILQRLVLNRLISYRNILFRIGEFMNKQIEFQIMDEIWWKKKSCLTGSTLKYLIIISKFMKSNILFIMRV